jgi:hypothetical protein
MKAINRDHSGDVLDKGEVVVVRLVGGDSEIESRAVLPCKTKIRVRWARYWCAMKANKGDHSGEVVVVG